MASRGHWKGLEHHQAKEDGLYPLQLTAGREHGEKVLRGQLRADMHARQFRGPDDSCLLHAWEILMTTTLKSEQGWVAMGLVQGPSPLVFPQTRCHEKELAPRAAGRKD